MPGSPLFERASPHWLSWSRSVQKTTWDEVAMGRITAGSYSPGYSPQPLSSSLPLVPLRLKRPTDQVKWIPMPGSALFSPGTFAMAANWNLLTQGRFYGLLSSHWDIAKSGPARFRQKRDRAEEGVVVGFLSKLLGGTNPPRETPKLGRNDLCWCGSGKKYKKCHLESDLRKKRHRAGASNCTASS